MLGPHHQLNALRCDVTNVDDVVLGRDYPHPIVQHDEARAETLSRYAVIKTASDKLVAKVARKAKKGR